MSNPTNYCKHELPIESCDPCRNHMEDVMRKTIEGRIITDENGNCYGSVQTRVRRYNTHTIKILPEYFNAVLDGSKKAELRFNDRGYMVGDHCILVDGERTIEIKITHIVELQYFIPEASWWVMFSFEVIYNE